MYLGCTMYPERSKENWTLTSSPSYKTLFQFLCKSDTLPEISLKAKDRDINWWLIVYNGIEKKVKSCSRGKCLLAIAFKKLKVGIELICKKLNIYYASLLKVIFSDYWSILIQYDWKQK